jgi:ribosomal protein L16 Arg81 hydroxylase
MSLTSLLTTITPDTFLDEYFFKLPFSSVGAAEAFRSLGDWVAVERLLGLPTVDLIIASQSLGIYPGPNPQTAAEAREVLRQGYTIGFRHVQLIDAPNRDLAGAFARDFKAGVDIHLYCTPAGYPGFGWHYDAEDVFVLQTEGSKEWALRKNTVNPWPLMETLPLDMAYHKEIMPLMKCRLQAGDWLYIPHGYWHATVADEDSISLSIGINAPSGIDFHDLLRAELLKDLRWRQRLPIIGAASTRAEELKNAAIREHIEELAKDLVRQLADDRTLQRFVAQLQRPATATDI